MSTLPLPGGLNITNQQIGSAVVGAGVRAGAELLKKYLQNEPQRAYNFEFSPPGLGLYSPEYIGQYCQAIQLPSYNIVEVPKLRYGAEQRGYAGDFTLGTVKATFMKPNPDVVYDYFNSWKDRIRDARGCYFPKQNYALTGYVMIQDTKQNVTTVVKMLGMFPVVWPDQRLSYQENGAVFYDVEFNVDQLQFL